MEEPDLNRMYETFIKIPQCNTISYLKFLHSTVIPLVRRLKTKGLISWYSFLVHDNKSGVPTDEEDKSPYVHLRAELAKGVESIQLEQCLPQYCLWTRKIEQEQLRQIKGVETSLLHEGKIEKAWKMVGECSDWISKFFEAHSDTAEIEPEQFVHQLIQFLHYIDNAIMVPAKRSIIKPS